MMKKTRRVSDAPLTRGERMVNKWTSTARARREEAYSGPQPGDPDTETIRQLCLEIQATWSPHVEYHRRVRKSPTVVLHEAMDFPEGIMV